MIWPYIILSYISLFVFGLSDNVRGPLFPEIMKEFAVNDSMGSWMFALSSISGFLSSYLARHLLRRFDRLTVLRGGAIALIISLVGLATAPHFYVFLVFSLFFGMSLGIVGLIPNVLVSLGSSEERKQQLLSGLHAMYGVASFCSPLIAASVEYLTGSWRWTFGSITIVPLFLLIYTFHGSHENLHQKAEFVPENHKLNKARNFKPQMFLALMVSFCVCAEIMISSRLALFMRRTANYDMEHSSLYVTYFFVGMLTGRSLFALIKFPISLRAQLSISLVLTALCTFGGIYLHPVFLPIAGFTVAPFYPLAITWISTKFPTDLDSAVSYMMATDSMMLVGMHLMVGHFTDNNGIAFAMLLGPIYCFLSFLLVNSYEYFFERHQPQDDSNIA
ncbi:sugar MFS transporter [Bdellovibrio sp. KM01]|uniref:MFS transporter n=1 Tax=Bdellovibrio sp. KM01 TaxID=2748865 RepID=UPI0015EAF6D4|nr:MFS transporter [Bdellovibrio sp. KM01]QLY24381.1 MFS transporter [Bdellovibrio sp. KM01]